MKVAIEGVFDENASFHDKANRALFKILEFRETHQLTIKLIQEEREMGTQTVMDAMQRVEQSVIDYIKVLIQKAIDQGEIKECNPELTAFVIVKLYFSLMNDWPKNHQPLGKEEISKLFELYLLNGLAK